MMQTGYTALIVDDEELARRLIREFLGKHKDITIVGECENGLQAVDEISRKNPDLIFLDIQMPKMNGLEVLAETGRRAGVIFTTAYDEYALKAFDLHAVDYLLKPYSQQRFDEALEQARLQFGREQKPMAQLLEATRATRLLIRDRGQTHVLAVEQIEYVEAQDDYIQIHAQGKTWMKTQSLSDLETQLDPAKFIRVHRSYLVNIAFVKSTERISKDGIVALMQDGNQVPVSRAGHERLRAAM
jgi:two-component system LytT family response regulator